MRALPASEKGKFMNASQIENHALQALNWNVERLEDQGAGVAALCAAIEERDQFAMRGLNAEDFTLFGVAKVLGRMATWTQARLGALSPEIIEATAEAITARLACAV